MLRTCVSLVAFARAQCGTINMHAIRSKSCHIWSSVCCVLIVAPASNVARITITWDMKIVHNATSRGI